MPELRIDPLSGLRVIVATERTEPPSPPSPATEPGPLEPGRDPFLEGNERKTLPEVWALRPHGGVPDSPGWTVRAVPNLHPALETGLDSSVSDPLVSGRGEPDLFAARPASGAHEVLVNTPEPLAGLHDLGAQGLDVAMRAWRERMRAHEGAAYVHVIVNEGPEAGASVAHSHAQLYALPFVPSAVARERERFTAYRDRTQGRNLLADVLQEEVRRRERLVAVDAEAVAICPFASQGPFHVQIVPRTPVARFEHHGPTGAALLHQVLGRLGEALGGVPPLNLWLRSAPRGADTFCWRIDLLPRLTQPAGLELGAGVAFCAFAPERAAAQLRSANPGA